MQGRIQVSEKMMNGGVAESRQQRSYRAFPGARNTTCMPLRLKIHDTLYMTIFA
jgi:hypothetical protein